MNYSRTFYISTILFFAMLMVSCSTTKTITYNNNDIIKSIRKEFAPDTRVALFDVKGVKKGHELVYSGETTSEEAKMKLLAETKARYKKTNIVDNIKVLPSKSLGEKVRGVVRISVCNIRSKPKHSSELSTQAILGTPVKILKKENSWYFIQTPDGYLGWVDEAGISPLNKYDQKIWFGAEKIIFTGIYGFVYSEPDEDSNPVSDITEGGILKLIGESLNKNFWVVGYPDNRVGYLSKKSSAKLKEYLKSKRQYTGSDISKAAFKLMGIPYLWGGTSAKAMDCSGFTKTVYFMQGILLPRDASQQVKVGKPIAIDKKFSNLRRGDLLFFGRKRKDGSDKITHVAIYLGDGKIIHETGDIKVQSLKRGDSDFAEHRLKTLMQARRIIGYSGKSGVKELTYVKDYWE